MVPPVMDVIFIRKICNRIKAGINFSVSNDAAIISCIINSGNTAVNMVNGEKAQAIIIF